MFVRNYVKVSHLDEAYALLLKNKTNVILGGGMYLRLGNRHIHTLIDLNNLGLQYIHDTPEFFKIGSQTTLREIELHKGLAKYFGNAFAITLSKIVGTQFRNSVTIGGTITSKHGFSDVLTILLSLNVNLYFVHRGKMTLIDFIEAASFKDVLYEVEIVKDQSITVYKDFRNSSGDYPILNMAINKNNTTYKVVVGSRPGKAKIAPKTSKYISMKKSIQEIEQMVAEELVYKTNMRASQTYRKALSKVLIRRILEELNSCI